MKVKRGFTLIELLVVVGIIGLLLSITMPSLKAARRAGRTAKCKHNLHEIGVAMQAYFSTHNDLFPLIAVLPSNESNAAANENREPYERMANVLKKETANTEEVFLCPDDEVTDETLTSIGIRVGGRYYDTETTSFEWNPLINPDYDVYSGQLGPQKRRRVRGTGIVQNIFRASLANLQMAYDFEPFHGGANRPNSVNALYADLHVDSE
jgi:prepilin-type N-terminal cleavage/methylation domain-containing protein